ncbi:MAG: DNA repair protein RecN [Bacteroidaceae bacterium]|nr:DNA repair protein RecN [Bacteroidaceae bacterium]
MLKHLHIENYALIEKLEIDIENGFTVITGETGAGKSILLGAIGLLTGERADLTAIQHGKTRCIIEAVFSIKEYNLKYLFDEEDLDYDGEECIIRRELTANGKSRAFINDTPTSLSVLKRMAPYLIDIHSQHQNLLLGKEDFQISILDTVVKNTDIRQKYNKAFTTWKNIKKELEQAISTLENNQKDEDYLRFLFDELEQFKPKPEEDEYLKQQCEKLEHAQEIKGALLQGNYLLTEGEAPILDTIRQTRNSISSIKNFFPEAEELAERLESCRVELQDIAETLESEGEEIEYDPELLEQVQSRLNTLYSLEQKHHVSTSEELIAIKNDLEAKLELVDNSEEHIAHLKKQEEKAKEDVIEIGENLTSSRQKAATLLEKEVIEKLSLLGMPKVRFKVSIQESPEPLSNGLDKVTFLFSANLGSDMQNISNVASGGEIARVMLTLKAIQTKTSALPTIIFDEIDTGVSGHIAESMAHIMRQMGKENTQVISITHLPQIASLGESHFKVWKEDKDGYTFSHITQLSIDERVEEIANMLSGSNVSTEAYNNAKVLLGIQ